MKYVFTMRYYFVIFLLLLAHAAHAQNYVMKSMCRDGVISLRWAPTNYEAWSLGNKYGYIVERYTVIRDSLFPEHFTRFVLTESPLRLASLDDWEANSDNDMVALAAQSIFDTAYVAHTPAEIYRQHISSQQRFAMALFAADVSSLTADLSALLFKDRTADRREKYLYKVHVAAPDSLALDTAFTFIGAATDTELPTIQKPSLFRGDKSLSIVWNTRFLSDFYTGYIVEKSSDGGQNYRPINDSPSLQFEQSDNNPYLMALIDSIPDNETDFYYRVVGITCFGERSSPSEAVVGRGINVLTSAPDIIGKKVIDNDKIQLEWYVSPEDEDAVEGFRIYRRSGPNEQFKVIKDFSDPKVRHFTDLLPDITNYYKMSAYNQNAEVITPYESYAELVDSFPPAIPVGLQGSIDTTGVVTVCWNRNSESDLSGYRVYSNNVQHGEFALQTPALLRDTVFRQTISLNTLSHDIFYQIRAVDARGNTSKPSEVLALERPDTIPPSAPKLHKPIGIDGKAHLKWTRSYSDDVVAYYILRRTADQMVLSIDTVTMLTDAEEMEYVDATAQYAVAYDYGVEATDRAGNRSRNTIWRRLEMRAPAVPAPSLKLKSDAGFNELIIKLPKEAANKTPITMLVYRAVDDDIIKSYDKVDNTLYYKDVNVTMGHIYSYSVRLLFSDGSESGMSNIIKQKQ